VSTYHNLESGIINKKQNRLKFLRRAGNSLYLPNLYFLLLPFDAIFILKVTAQIFKRKLAEFKVTI
jgi:hypothetical protein